MDGLLRDASLWRGRRGGQVRGSDGGLLCLLGRGTREGLDAPLRMSYTKCIPTILHLYPAVNIIRGIGGIAHLRERWVGV